MTRGMRWRIVTLQAVLVVVLGVITGFLYWGSNFTKDQVRNELTAQQIYFPGKDQVKAGGALDPAEFKTEIVAQAGNQVTTGDQARIYANDFIAVHLEGVAKDPVTGKVILDANGKPMTYATMGDYINQQKAAGASASTITTLNAERDTIFKGEMLRGTLLNAYAWWTMGVYAGYATIAMAIAAVAVFGALVFEAFTAYYRRDEKVTVPAGAGKAAAAVL